MKDTHMHLHDHETDAGDNVTTPDTPRRRYKREWQEAKRRAEGVKKAKKAECGTIAAYRRHHRNGEPVDKDCREAWNNHRREQRAKKREARKADQPGS